MIPARRDRLGRPARRHGRLPRRARPAARRPRAPRRGRPRRPNLRPRGLLPGPPNGALPRSLRAAHQRPFRLSAKSPRSEDAPLRLIRFRRFWFPGNLLKTGRAIRICLVRNPCPSVVKNLESPVSRLVPSLHCCNVFKSLGPPFFILHPFLRSRLRSFPLPPPSVPSASSVLKPLCLLSHPRPSVSIRG